MSHRGGVIGVVVPALIGLIVGGTAIAAASPHAITASGCRGETSPYLAGDARWDLGFSCKKGSFTRFHVSTNHVIYPSVWRTRSDTRRSTSWPAGLALPVVSDSSRSIGPQIRVDLRIAFPPRMK
jgi:hypothetical protein